MVAKILTAPAMATLSVTCLLLSFGQAGAAQTPGIEQGRQCFEQMKKLEAEYDPRSITMISDKAKVHFTLPGKGNAPQEIDLDAVAYKKKANEFLPEMKKNKYKVDYSDITVAAEGAAFRVNGNADDGMNKIAFSTLYSIDSTNHCSIDEIKVTHK